MQEHFDLLIIFWDGARKIVKNVSNYGYNDLSSSFYYDKNKYRSFIPREMVMFLGRKSDYEED